MVVWMSNHHGQTVHTNLNRKSWNIISPGTVHEGPIAIERDSTNYAPLSVYSTVSNMDQEPR